MAKMAKEAGVKGMAKPCPTGQHRMPGGKCMKDSEMKKSNAKPGGMPLRKSSGYGSGGSGY